MPDLICHKSLQVNSLYVQFANFYNRALIKYTCVSVRTKRMGFKQNYAFMLQWSLNHQVQLVRPQKKLPGLHNAAASKKALHQVRLRVNADSGGVMDGGE